MFKNTRTEIEIPLTLKGKRKGIRLRNMDKQKGKEAKKG